MASNLMGPLYSFVDVLVVGAGPAGSIMGAALARSGIKARVVDKRDQGVLSGQADGLSPRTLEIFRSLGMWPEINRQAEYLALTITTWQPNGKGGIERGFGFKQEQGKETEFGGGRCLNQGRVEKTIQACAKRYSENVTFERGVLPISLKIDEVQGESDDAYPVEIVLQHLLPEEATVSQNKAFVKDSANNPANGMFRSNIGPSTHTEDLIAKVEDRVETKEIVRAKYVVGCDGAWSWIRRQLGIEMEGDAADNIWGAMDILPITDFPDARGLSLIQSDAGGLLWIPREQNLTRLYIQLKEVKPGENGAVDRSKITPDQITREAQKIMHPYHLNYQYCDWWTAYQVGQRVGKAYSDPLRRVFLAGDAVHTHSPKEGLGMNTSMQDAFNLAWKLAAVINKESPASILSTYEPERRPVAQDLIALDKTISAAFSGGVYAESLSSLYMDQQKYMHGYVITYPPSMLVSEGAHLKKVSAPEDADTPPLSPSTSGDDKDEKTKVGRSFARYGASPCTLAPEISIGARVSVASITMHTGAFPRSVLETADFDGRWRLVIFAGDVKRAGQLARVNKLGTALSDSKTGLLRLKHRVPMSRNLPFPHALHSETGRLVQPREREFPLVDLITVHASERYDTELSDFHNCFWPMDDLFGRAYDKIFCGAEAHDELGIDRQVGCQVLVRPDHHVAWIGDIDDYAGLKEFLSGCVRL